MANIFLHEITLQEFRELFIEAFRETQFIAPDYRGISLKVKTCSSVDQKSTEKEVYLTRQQTADFLQISLPTLHQYTKDSLITSFRIGNKIRYKQADIEKAMKERNFGRRVS
jgi:hypothetical protein